MTAQVAYRDKSAAVKAILKRISAQVKNHAGKIKGDKCNWALAGDLGKVLENLNEASEFLS